MATISVYDYWKTLLRWRKIFPSDEKLEVFDEFIKVESLTTYHNLDYVVSDLTVARLKMVYNPHIRTIVKTYLIQRAVHDTEKIRSDS